MAIVVGLVLFVVAAWLLFKLLGTVLGLVMALLLAALVGAAADKIVPGRLPYGFLGAIGAGLLGAALGTLLMGKWGPVLFGLPLLPAFVGAVIVAVVVELIMTGLARRRVA